LNFLIQSTSSDITLSQMVKINDLLEKWETKTKIAFTVHDSVVLDFSIEDRYLLGDIRSLMSATRWGNFEVGMEIGKDYGNMKKMRGDV
jgi:DNA polymerase I-like protein with 3'-5' exonuclease and polymerase domains